MFLRSANFCGLPALVAGLLLASGSASAGIIPYTLSDFTLSNTNADGDWNTPDGGLTLNLIGGNNGSGLGGTTDFLLIAPVTVTFQFDYLYSSQDIPGYDRGGYVLNHTFNILGDTDGLSGTITVTVNAGEDFGFRVETDDNTGEPGILTVSTFEAVSTPEPGGPWLVMVSAGAMAIAQGYRRSVQRKRGLNR
jgi:hypothetical protein